VNAVPDARPREPAERGSDPASVSRGHEVLPHTADTGLRAWAPDLPGLFEEAAAALAEIAADVAHVVVEPGQPGEAVVPGKPGDVRVVLEARDLAGLAFEWLNELIGLSDVRHAALAGTSVGRVDATLGRHELQAVARYIDRDTPGVRPRHDVKSATFHGLAVERQAGGWSLTAYLDI
jgi:SHS2 domain-containing protein